jgi:hypothetical protein
MVAAASGVSLNDENNSVKWRNQTLRSARLEP